MSVKRALTMAVVLVSSTSAACRPEDQRTDTIDAQEALREREDLDPAVVMHLDSGSVLFRADDLEGALEQYRMATELAPDAAAAWFGVYMAEHALGNVEEAAEALERAQSQVPGATLLHPPSSDTVR